jgi:prepilin signal peptidase PulO-like enzyme (type II secretory pathway)
MSVLIVVYLFALGLIFGSFINAWVWRLRQQLDDDGEPKKLSKSSVKNFLFCMGEACARAVSMFWL